jgi:hypothetical protein
MYHLPYMGGTNMVMESYFEIHAPPAYPRRGKRKRANINDPNAKHADIAYQENYGL